MKYEEKDVPKFQEEVCKKTCIMKGKCIEEGQSNHWFLMCPHYFNWKLEIPQSWVAEQIDWQREHPEEVEKQKKKNLEVAKKIKEEKKKTKKTKEE